MESSTWRSRHRGSCTALACRNSAQTLMNAASAALFLRGGFVGFARAAENIGQRVVAFVAGVFVQRIGRCVKRIFDRPWPGESSGVFHGGAVEKGPRIDATEPL